MQSLILFIFILFFSSLHAKSEILYQKDSYIFTQKNVDELIIMGEFIARSSFSKEDKKNLKAWSIEDFTSAPKNSVVFYKFVSADVIPYILAKTARTTYPTELYGNIRNIFEKEPDSSPHNFLAIIEKYNPPIKELYLMREHEFKLIQQMLLNNQQNFNIMMNTQQQNSNILINSIKDHSLHQSIAIEEGTILQESDNDLLIKSPDGKEYPVSK